MYQGFLTHWVPSPSYNTSQAIHAGAMAEKNQLG